MSAGDTITTETFDVQPRRRAGRRGMSLIETLVAISVMGTAAIMYASAWRTNAGFNDVAREIELATEIYLRQVERIRGKSVLDGILDSKPFPPAAVQVYPFKDGNCAPPIPLNAGDPIPAGFTYYRAGQPVVKHDDLLRTANSIQIPANTPADAAPTNDQAWVPNLHPDLVAQGFAVQVFVARVHDQTDLTKLNKLESNLHQLLKYRIRIERNVGGGPRHILTGEFLQEVR